jgi:hypothetical protein
MAKVIRSSTNEDISNPIKLFPNPVKDELNFDKTSIWGYYHH